MKSNRRPEPDIERLIAECEPWFEWLRSQGRSPMTLRNYRCALVLFSRFMRDLGVQDLKEVQQSHLATWLRAMVKRKLSLITINTYFPPIFGLFAWLEERGEVFLNPSRGLEIPVAHKHLLSVISEPQMVRLIESIDGTGPVDVRDRAILEVAYATGFRCQELISLDVASIDFTQGVVRAIGKGEKERVGLLTAAALAALRNYLNGARTLILGSSDANPALWLGQKSASRIRGAILRKVVKRRAHAIGVKLTPHGIRRSFATHLLRRGASPLELKHLLGHASFKHLKHYLRYAPEDLLKTHRRSPLGQ